MRDISRIVNLRCYLAAELLPESLPHSQLKCNKVTHWLDPDKITVLALLEIPLHAGKTSDSE
ncbi:MAG: hypothetical protein RL248_1862, partial [Pseudomonadota bacterium]